MEIHKPYKSIMKAFKNRCNRLIMKLLPVDKRFDRIYRRRQWGGVEAESRSGRGSSISATENIRHELPRLLDRYQIQILLDLGCGDFHWMKHVDLSGVKYIGADIVQTVVDENDKQYGSADKQFISLDGSVDPLPRGIDAVLCREVIFHLSFKDGLTLVRNICSSGATYLIATQMKNDSENKDTYTGGFRPVDLTKAPYHFPQPMEVIADDAITDNRSLCVWKISEIQMD